MFISIARFMPKVRDSYLMMLFVQLNSSIYNKRVVFSEDLKTIRTPDLALECAPSKSNPQDVGQMRGGGGGELVVTVLKQFCLC
jgi:hypothetical protein